MTFFVIVAWVLLFLGICFWLLFPGFIVAMILVLLFSFGNPKDNPNGAFLGGLTGFGIYCYTIWWYLHNIQITWMVQP